MLQCLFNLCVFHIFVILLFAPALVIKNEKNVIFIQPTHTNLCIAKYSNSIIWQK